MDKLTKIQEKRLLNVAQALRDAHKARKRFVMAKFVFGSRDDIAGEYDEEVDSYVTCNKEENFCGTPACALGHYAARTDLQRLLKIAIIENEQHVKYAALAFFGEKPEADDENCPQYDDVKFQEHFGLDFHEMEQLFSSDGCDFATTALQAAKYIERFVKQKQYPGRFTNY